MVCGGFCIRLANVAIGKNATFATGCVKKRGVRLEKQGLWAFRAGEKCLFGAGTGKIGTVGMIFWILAGAVVVASTLMILRAAQLAPEGPQSGNPDLEVYRGQLAEVERDAARGIIGASEAEGLRTEIKRRILSLDRATTQSPAAAPSSSGFVVPGALVLAMCAGAFALYGWLGAPGYRDLPHAARVAKAEQLKAERPSQAQAEAEAAKTRPAPTAPAADYAKLMDELRAAVAARPDDVTGLRLLADNERKLGNLEASARAMESLIAALGDKATAPDHAALADSLITAAGGIVTAEAEAAIVDSLTADKTNGTARFYAGLLEAQTGRPDRAFRLWNDLRKDGPPDAPWAPYIDSQMEMLAAAAGANYTPPETKGPQAGDVAAAAQMTAKDRAEMIKGMVAGLEDRLFTTGGSAAEWAQLLTALGVLGDADRAKTAWAKAQVALAGDAAGLDQVREAARQVGVSP